MVSIPAGRRATGGKISFLSLVVREVKGATLPVPLPFLTLLSPQPLLTHKALLLAVPQRCRPHTIGHQGKEGLLDLKDGTEQWMSEALILPSCCPSVATPLSTCCPLCCSCHRIFSQLLAHRSLPVFPMSWHTLDQIPVGHIYDIDKAACGGRCGRTLSSYSSV